MKYSFSKKETEEIDSILENGINQINNTNNYFEQGTLNTLNINSNYITRMKNDIKELQESLNNLEQKLKPNKKNSSKYQNNYSEYLSRKYIVEDNIDNSDIINKITELEIEILNKKYEIEKEERNQFDMKEEINNLKEEIIKEKIENNKRKEKLENMRGYKNECEIMQFKFDTLIKEFDYSEEERQKQKNKLQKLQKEIDFLRQHSLNRITEIEILKKLNLQNLKK